MTRGTSATAGMTLLLALIITDFVLSRPDPYQQPAIFALGSGAASAGGFCGALPD